MDLFTDIDLSWTDPVDQLKSHQCSMIGATILIQNLYGALLILPYLPYEKYGQDPQKRGLKTQMLSQISIVILVSNWITMPVTFWRYVIGPVSVQSYLVLLAGANSYVFNIFVNRIEVDMFRFVSVVVLNRMPNIIDDFLARFLGLTNFVIGFLLMVVNSFTSYAFNLELYLTGRPVFLRANETQLTFNLFSIVIVFYLGFALIVNASIKAMTLLRSRDEVSENNLPGRSGLNNAAYNKDIISAIMEFLATIAGFAVGLVVATSSQQADPRDLSDPELLARFLILNLGHTFASMVVPVTIVYLTHSDLRRYVLEFYGLRLQNINNHFKVDYLSTKTYINNHFKA